MSLVQMSLSGGILILVIALLRFISIKRLPKSMFLILWVLALSKLLIPASFSSSWSIFNMVHMVAPVYPMTVGAEGSFLGSEHWFDQTIQWVAGTSHGKAPVFAFIWVLGVVLLAAFFTCVFYRNQREIKTALPVEGQKWIETWQREQRICRSIRITQSDRITSPLTYGLIRPCITLPKGMDLADELQLRHVLTHEMVHIKRFDGLWKLLAVGAVCLHWFNPMAWVLFVLLNRDLEIACDEKVIQILGEDAKSAYAMSIIKMTERRMELTSLYNGFSRNAAEERIVLIMKYKKISVAALTGAILLLVGVTSVFATTASNSIKDNISPNANGEQLDLQESYSVNQDESGVVTLKDGNGRIISETGVESTDTSVLIIKNDNKDGKVFTLEDGNGKVLGELRAEK